MGLSSTVSEINGDFSRKTLIFPTTAVYFAPPLKGFPLELGIGAGVINQNEGRYIAEQEL